MKKNAQFFFYSNLYKQDETHTQKTKTHEVSGGFRVLILVVFNWPIQGFTKF